MKKSNEKKLFSLLYGLSTTFEKLVKYKCVRKYIKNGIRQQTEYDQPDSLFASIVIEAMKCGKLILEISSKIYSVETWTEYSDWRNEGYIRIIKDSDEIQINVSSFIYTDGYFLEDLRDKIKCVPHYVVEYYFNEKKYKTTMSIEHGDAFIKYINSFVES